MIRLSRIKVPGSSLKVLLLQRISCLSSPPPVPSEGCAPAHGLLPLHPWSLQPFLSHPQPLLHHGLTPVHVQSLQPDKYPVLDPRLLTSLFSFPFSRPSWQTFLKESPALPGWLASAPPPAAACLLFSGSLPRLKSLERATLQIQTALLRADPLFLGAEVCPRRGSGSLSGGHPGSERGEELAGQTRSRSGRVPRWLESVNFIQGFRAEVPSRLPGPSRRGVCSEPPPAPQCPPNARTGSCFGAPSALPPGANSQLSEQLVRHLQTITAWPCHQCREPLSTLAVARLKRVASTQKALYKWPEKPIFFLN